ncbi:MAG: hypothetical protein ACRD4F_19655 [Candidatus Angelobacter sp.]
MITPALDITVESREHHIPIQADKYALDVRGGDGLPRAGHNALQLRLYAWSKRNHLSAAELSGTLG